jgi:hypothetical protein
VQVIDPHGFDTILRFPVGSGTDPRDIAVVDASRAYESRYDSRWLLVVDPSTGAPTDSIDLGEFADADGLPEAAWMELDGSRLFVQVQRVDRLASGTTVPPALLAVVAPGRWRPRSTTSPAASCGASRRRRWTRARRESSGTGLDGRGRPVPRGFYVVRVRGPGFVASAKLHRAP